MPAAGTFANTRRVGAIVSGPIIAGGASSALGYGGVFALSAVMTAVDGDQVALRVGLAAGHGAPVDEDGGQR